VQSENLSCALLALGLNVGDRVGIWGPSTIEWLLAQFACADAGLVLVRLVLSVWAHLQVNINPAYQSNELAYCINKVGVRALIMIDAFKTQQYYNLLANECHSLPSSRPGQVKDDRCVLRASTATRIFNDQIEIIATCHHVRQWAESAVCVRARRHTPTHMHSGTWSFDELERGGAAEPRARLQTISEQLSADAPSNIQFTSGTTGPFTNDEMHSRRVCLE